MSTAWFRFRTFSPANYFMAAAGLGLEYVEVPLYRNAERWWGPFLPQDMKDLAATCGVTMVSGVAAVDLVAPFDMLGRPLTDDVARFNGAFAMALIDKAAALGLEVVRIAEPNVSPEHQHLAEQYVKDMGEALRPTPTDSAPQEPPRPEPPDGHPPSPHTPQVGLNQVDIPTRPYVGRTHGRRQTDSSTLQ